MRTFVGCHQSSEDSENHFSEPESMGNKRGVLEKTILFRSVPNRLGDKFIVNLVRLKIYFV